MTITRRFNFINNEQITALCVNGNFVWTAFAQNSDAVCILEKQFVSQPDQVFFSIEKTVNKILKIVGDNTNIYVAYQDDTLFGEIFSVLNPLTTTTEITIPSGITEYPVDIFVNGTDLFFLLPGSASGTNAQLIKYNTSGVFQEIIDLNQSGDIVTNAQSMTIDSLGDIWIVTNSSPANVIRVYELSGGGWAFTITEII